MIQSGLVKYHEDLQHLLVDIDKVHQHPDNYNNGDVESIAESIEVNGMYRPIYVQASTGYIIAGNHTWVACKGLGAEQIPVVMLEVNDEEAVRIMLADNRLASLAVPDHARELALLERLQASHTGLLGSGYLERDVEAIRLLSEMPVEYDSFAQWPTLSFQVHPRVRKAFFDLTREAETDPERFELLLRLAGWDGQ